MLDIDLFQAKASFKRIFFDFFYGIGNCQIGESEASVEYPRSNSSHGLISIQISVMSNDSFGILLSLGLDKHPKIFSVEINGRITLY